MVYKPAYRRDIDGLRAIAVLAVLAFHLDPVHVGGGFVGVDVFFVISGFLISKIIISEIDGYQFSLLAFYERRARRLLPALFVMILGVVFIALVLLPPTELELLINSAAYAAASLSNLYFSRHTGYFDLGSDALPLIHTWSLAVEEQFYIAAPVLFFVCRRWLRAPWATIFASLTLASLVVSVVDTSLSPSVAFFSPFTRAWEFLVGSALAVGIVPRSPRWMAEALAVIGVILIGIAVFEFDEQTAFPGLAAIVPCAGSCLLILAGSRPTFIGAILGATPAVMLGRISYSLYLWHWPVIVFARMFWGGQFNLLEMAATGGVSLVFAYLSWRFIEEPPRRDEVLFTRRRLFVGSAVAAVALASLSPTINALHGLPWRFGPAARAYLADVPWNVPPSCRDGYGCSIGAPTAPIAFAVIGDSIGRSLLPGLDEVAQEHGVAGLFLTKAGCYPLLAIQADSCAQFEEAAIKQVTRLPVSVNVILVGRWTTAIEGRRFGLQNSLVPAFADADVSRQTAIFAGFRRTIAALKGHRVFVLANVPEQPIDVPTTAAVLTNLGFAPPLGVTRTAFEERTARTRDTLARLTGITVLDASKILCQRDRCGAVRGGRSLYADDNHLSVIGARFLAAAPLMRAPITQPATQAEPL